MLELKSVTKSYAGILAVDRITFHANAGEVTGYLGANGSGKSTTMKLICGLIQPTSGEIYLDGKPIQKQQLGYVPEEPHLYSHLSGLEYLEMVRQLRGLPADGRVEEFLRQFGLHSDRQVAISSYSKGMRQKILLTAALLHNPRLVVLDEPFSGLDIETSYVLRILIEELAHRGKVVLFSSHELETVERICSRVVIIHRGRIVEDDSVAAMRRFMALPELEGQARQIADLVEAG